MASTLFSSALQQGLEILLGSLESSRLEVVLVPSKRSDDGVSFIRRAASRNAYWYRDFCGRHLSSRTRRNLAPDTRIKRRNVIRMLEALIAGRAVRSKYRDNRK